MTARYLLCPGPVRSRTDGDWHHVTASRLAMLYGVPMGECIVLPLDWYNGQCLRARVASGELIELRPRFDGNYTLPEPARPANPNGCYNRAPFKTTVHVADGRMPDGHSFPFRMAMDCQYTLSDLGQKDPRCVGCRWRRAP